MKQAYLIFARSISMIFFIVWMIYGNIMFWKPTNDCDLVSDTIPMHKLMLALLWIGYV